MAKKLAAKPKKRELPKGLERALAERKAGIDSEALLKDLIEIWGGPRQLAIDIHSEFQKGSVGGMTRQRILEMLQRLILTNTTHDIGRVAKPSDLTNEELEELALHYTAKVSGQPANSASGSPAQSV